MVDKDKKSLKNSKTPVEAEQSSSDDSEPENLQYKVVVLGNGTVGKTSLVMRFCED